MYGASIRAASKRRSLSERHPAMGVALRPHLPVVVYS
jgi:hypothetical protein